MRPFLVFIKSFRVSPPLVRLAEPWKTWALVPTVRMAPPAMEPEFFLVLLEPLFLDPLFLEPLFALFAGVLEELLELLELLEEPLFFELLEPLAISICKH